MSYLNSGDIIAFPATSRADTYQKDARLLTEESLVRPLRLLRSNESFVISSLSEVNNNNILEMLIAGYYIKVTDFQNIKNAASISSSGNYDLYASITLGTVNGYLDIVGVDDSSSPSQYTGVNFQKVASGGTPPTPGTNEIILFIGQATYGNSTLTLNNIGTPPLIDGGEI